MRNGGRAAGRPPGDLDGLSWGYRLGALGAAIGIIAGAVQWAFGSEIPEWTGNKLHPEQLGLITIALSALALVSLRVSARRPGPSPIRVRFLVGVAVLIPTIICFTTVGRLWYLPGALLLVGGALILVSSDGETQDVA